MSSTDWLTAALVVITAYYAWQNRKMVREMAETRALAVLPQLALDWHAIGPIHAFVRVASVGPGPALDVKATLRFVPLDATGIREPIVRHLNTSLMTPGQASDFMTDFGESQPMLTMEAMAQTFERIELIGTMRDAAGRRHDINDSLADLASWQRTQREAHISWRHPDPEKRLAQEFKDILKQPTAEIVRALSSLSADSQR